MTKLEMTETTAAGWEKWSGWHGRELEPIDGWLLEAAELRPGQRVLDVACGAGHPTLPAAARVGPAGRVVGVDVSADLLAVTRRLAAAAGLGNVETAEMSAQELRFPDASFDAVTCSQALMFFPDPATAVAEMRRVVMPGGRVATVVWSERAHNPFFTTFFDVLNRFLPVPPPDPGAPGQFRLGPPGELEAVLRAGGLFEISVERRPITFTMDAPEDYWQLMLDCVAPVRNAVAALGDHAPELRDAVIAAAGAGPVRLAAVAVCGVGRRV